MGKLDKLQKRNDDSHAEASAIANHLFNLGDELLRIAGEFGRIGEILTDIDKDFSKATSIINPKDLKFLFLATGLLCTKWIIMGQIIPLDFDYKHTPKPMEERCDHDETPTGSEGDEIEKKKEERDQEFGEVEDESKNYSDDGYRTVGQILFRPVPYDSISKFPEEFGVAAFNKNPDGLGGKNHRVFTLGHDPILGWIFGTIDIMTRSLTLKSPFLKMYKVHEKGNKMDCVTTFGEEVGNVFRSIQEGMNHSKKIERYRLQAAIFKQGEHFLSDKYTKDGLPIPFLSPEKAFELMQKGWNSVELSRAIKKVLTKTAKNGAIIGAQFFIAFLINEIIKNIHLLMYEEDRDGDIKSYQVRTRKILIVANSISSTSNVLFCAIFGVATKNPVEAAKRLDLGGFIETIRRLIIDTKFINEIKREYVKQALRERILNTTNFDWWYVNEKGEISYE